MAPKIATIDVFSDVGAPARALGRKDPALKQAHKAIGKPHIRRRDGGFEGLFRIIVEQQVSVPSAQAIWKRCRDNVDCASPGAVAELGEEGLKRLGLSTPKARYILGIAEAIGAGVVDFAALSGLADEDAMASLVALKGVGPWTASIYLLFCEGRVDIWPPNDVALKHAYSAAGGAPIEQKDLDQLAAGWTPWRGVAAHILWTYYAHLRGRAPI
ncbi:MAG: DNA-3-methyladenine glycosylase family protein [Pseudomonadota bacterium]